MTYYLPLLAAIVASFALSTHSVLKRRSLSPVEEFFCYAIPLILLPYFYPLGSDFIGFSLNGWRISVVLGAVAGLLLRILGDELPAYIVNIWQTMRCPCGVKATQSRVELTMSTPPNIHALGISILFECLIGPFLEEIIYRGLIYNILAMRLAPWLALLVSSAIFALGHWPRFEAKRFPLFLLYALAYGYLFQITGTLVAPFVAHLVFNLYANVLPLINARLRKDGRHIPFLTYRPLPASVHGIIAVAKD